MSDDVGMCNYENRDLGSGCAKCRKKKEIVEQEVSEAGINAEIISR